MFIKNCIYAFSFAFLAIPLTAQQAENIVNNSVFYTPILITSLVNASEQPLIIFAKEQMSHVAADAHKILLKNPVEIPFISISHYLKAFTYAALGAKLGIPKGATIVQIGTRKFGIWENEMGIICASDAKDKEAQGSGYYKLLKNVNKSGQKDNQLMTRAFCYLLSINKKGKMVLDSVQNT